MSDEAKGCICAAGFGMSLSCPVHQGSMRARLDAAKPETEGDVWDEWEGIRADLNCMTIIGIDGANYYSRERVRDWAGRVNDFLSRVTARHAAELAALREERDRLRGALERLDAKSQPRHDDAPAFASYRGGVQDAVTAIRAATAEGERR